MLKKKRTNEKREKEREREREREREVTNKKKIKVNPPPPPTSSSRRRSLPLKWTSRVPSTITVLSVESKNDKRKKRLFGKKESTKKKIQQQQQQQQQQKKKWQYVKEMLHLCTCCYDMCLGQPSTLKPLAADWHSVSGATWSPPTADVARSISESLASRFRADYHHLNLHFSFLISIIPWRHRDACLQFAHYLFSICCKSIVH